MLGRTQHCNAITPYSAFILLFRDTDYGVAAPKWRHFPGITVLTPFYAFTAPKWRHLPAITMLWRHLHFYLLLQPIATSILNCIQEQCKTSLSTSHIVVYENLHRKLPSVFSAVLIFRISDGLIDANFMLFLRWINCCYVHGIYRRSIISQLYSYY